MLFLLVAILSTNLLHSYLLVSQRFQRKETISEHAAKHRQTHVLYIIGHTVGAVSFYVFAKQFFYAQHQATLLMALVSVGVLAEVVQAFLPARDQYKKAHELFAYTMALMTVLVALLAPLQIPHNGLVQAASLALGVIIALSIVIIHLINRRYFWMLQMIGTAVFHLEMVLIVMGR